MGAYTSLNIPFGYKLSYTLLHNFDIEVDVENNKKEAKCLRVKND